MSIWTHIACFAAGLIFGVGGIVLLAKCMYGDEETMEHEKDRTQ